ncbi:MAG: 2,3-bisphosphoglycerate-independent phosphoglycerate mutase [Pseudomonadales bacterium]
MAEPAAKKTCALIILDGWGYREDGDSNAIEAATTPVWDRLWASAPHSLISASGEDVGLPDGQMGNSEVGHMSLGAGRIVYQSMTRIDKALEDGSFNTNPVYVDAIDTAVNSGKAVHVMGLLSPGGVHSHENHIHAIVQMAAQRGAKQLYVHAFLDGRDTPPRSALPSLQKLNAALVAAGVGQIASICGRYYAMDRDDRWDRVEAAYRLLTESHAEFVADNAEQGLEMAYARDENDEFVQATTIKGATPITDGDAVIFMNFRADRARELTRAFTETEFSGFPRVNSPVLADFVMTTEYAANIDASCAYAPATLANGFGEHLAKLGKTQLRIAETEKYAHVTFFFSGGREELYEGEQRELIPSPKVATYDLQPEMSAVEVTDKLVEAIISGQFDGIVCNFANGDMVGHTGIFNAAVKAVETIDRCLGRIVDALRKVDGQCLITADHGNVEQMIDHVSGQPHTAHTCDVVPLVYVGSRAVTFNADAKGRLCDVAPTLLRLMRLEQPAEMTGTPLLTLD